MGKKGEGRGLKIFKCLNSLLLVLGSFGFGRSGARRTALDNCNLAVVILPIYEHNVQNQTDKQIQINSNIKTLLCAVKKARSFIKLNAHVVGKNQLSTTHIIIGVIDGFGTVQTLDSVEVLSRLHQRRRA